MTKSNILSPILPIGLQSIRDGRILPEPCPYALALLPQRSSTHMTSQIIASTSTALPNANVIVLEPSPAQSTENVSISNIFESVNRTTDQNISLQASDNPAMRRMKRKKIIVKLRSIVKRSHCIVRYGLVT